MSNSKYKIKTKTIWDISENGFRRCILLALKKAYIWRRNSDILSHHLFKLDIFRVCSKTWNLVGILQVYLLLILEMLTQTLSEETCINANKLTPSAAYLLWASFNSSQFPHGKKPEHILCLQNNNLPFTSDCGSRFRRQAYPENVGRGSARSLAGEQSKRTARSIGLGLRPELLWQLRAQTSGQGPLISKIVICQ